VSDGIQPGRGSHLNNGSASGYLNLTFRLAPVSILSGFKPMRLHSPRVLLASLFLAASSAIAQAPVEKDHPEKMAKSAELFARSIRPVFLKHCFQCHGGEKVESELDLTDRAGLMKGGVAGPSVVPGDAKKSVLFRMVSHTRKAYMPYEADKLPEATIKEIGEWIELGAAYDKPLLEKKDDWQTRKIAREARDHWSFQPLQRVPLPPVKQEAWIASPVDRFILAKLEAKGVAPNPKATKQQLLRRVYFDLIGLPPTPEETEAFLKDESPNAYEKLVDRLLQSPHYGERWARHWLDLARFAESHGFEHDYDRPSAYHYRDFVIQAFNQDLPYTTFVKWQLAGDEYEPKNPQALMATGFLAAGVHSTQITANEVEKHRYDEMDDMLATTSTTFLGLTVGCARCHDHKFDPIPAGDYYRMLSTFTTTVRTEVEVQFDPEGDRKAKEAFDQKHRPLLDARTKYEETQLPQHFAAWDADRASRPLPKTWLLPEIKSTKSGGSKLTKQDDGSVLVGGTNPPIETLTFVLNTDQPTLTGIRLEAMTHPTLVKNGPGRASNGNFALTDFKVSAAPKKGSNAVDVPLKNPRSTFDQKGLGIAGAIDADPVTSGWAVDPQFGKDHAAAFDFVTPVQNPEGSTLTVTMKFHNNVGHGMGRPRLSLSTQSEPLPLDAGALSSGTQQLLDLPIDKRTPEQTAKLVDFYKPLDAEWAKLDRVVQDHLKVAPKPSNTKVLVSSEGLQAVRLHTQGDDFLKETHFLKRGDPANKEGIAPAGYLQVLMRSENDASLWRKPTPQDSKLSFRRTALAEWMCDVENGSGHVLARVIVNRLWQHHFGRGIVSTPSDFGLRGEKPTHPELLDYLASQLVENGWKLKPIHKLMLMSSAYQQSSHIDESKQKIDRENALFWRFPVRRLEGEVIRDSMLAVSGQLDGRMFGPGTLDESSKRRSVYFTMKRSRLIPSLIIFDAPDGNVGIGERPATTIAPQALHLMNNPQVRAYARGLGEKMNASDVSESIRRGYRLTLSREPTAEELKEGNEFVKSQMATYQKASKPNSQVLALTDFAQVLLCLNEFVFVE
jgi:hypothetical protein